MTDQKHFKYDGTVRLAEMPKPNVTITSVEFLTPARVTLKMDEVEKSVMVNIDIINRKVYDDKGDTILSDLVFEHLDYMNTLPEDFFAASDDIQEKASEIDERLQQSQDIIGEQHG